MRLSTLAILYVHIGTHKTGTTSLQNFLYNNRNELAKCNLVYPELGLHPGLKGHHPIAFKLAGRKTLMNQQLSQTNIKEIFQKVGGLLQKGNDVLLSSEDFARLSLSTCPRLPSRLASVVPETTEFRIVVYLRRQDLFLRSFYDWEKKNGRMWPSNLDLQYARENIYLQYGALLERWEAVFGRDSIVVRPFEKESLVAGDVIDDFCEQVGLGGFRGRREPDTHKLNAAFAARELQAMDYIRDVVSGPAPTVGTFSKLFVKRFSDSLQLGGGGTGFVSPSLARDIIEMSSADNNRVAKAYLHRDQLFLNERVSDDFEPPYSLQVAELKQIETLLKTELLRFNREEALQKNGNRMRSRQPLRMRSSLIRKQWKIGAIRFSIGGMLRMSELLKRKLWSKLHD